MGVEVVVVIRVVEQASILCAFECLLLNVPENCSYAVRGLAAIVADRREASGEGSLRSKVMKQRRRALSIDGKRCWACSDDGGELARGFDSER